MLRRPMPALLLHTASAGTDIKAESSHIFADAGKIRLSCEYFGADSSRPDFPLAPGR